MIILLTIAAFFESYVTYLMSNAFDKDEKNVGLPIWLSFLILGGSLSFMVWYFVLYPIKVNKRLTKITAAPLPAATVLQVL
jgi:hypothetical protein